MTAPTRVVIEPGFTAPVHVPVLVIGAGACGLTAALRLADHGIECVLAERDERPAGSTSRCGSNCSRSMRSNSSSTACSRCAVMSEAM